ncbi:competence/damage-inducible protein A [Niallia sp. NCCP-28]|uniref:competence/damage-inducible protein A n=1 Tax=Niallia sp. NCCP-28 TaxID=2934712 RepID=UPI002081F107|nr:competence/damage-inducible protein A [Niallia sp. NCCP-28]GKU82549.1 putative competence-damage inducible protein [Niallia sp. NCCP-28]
MNAEIIAVGSELLLGQIANTNAQFISKQLAELGVNVFYHTAVGDNASRLEQVIKIAESRSDLLIFTGGLGPTKDDLTKETIAKHMGLELIFDKEALESIKEYFVKTNRAMTENNKKQALVLDGCKVLKNNHGMAPGMFLAKNNCHYMLLPGPPSEMQPMFATYGISALQEKLMNKEVILSRVLRFFGIGESLLETKIEDLIDAQANPTIAPLAGDGEVTLRITSKTDSMETAEKLIQETEQKILERVGEYFYGYDDTTLVQELVKKLQEQELTVAAAESLTGGMFQQELTSIAGAGSVFKGGVVCYTNEVKRDILSVKESTIKEMGVVSEQCAKELAENVQKLVNSDIGISFTGVAGPDDLEGHPAGTVYLGIAVKGKATIVEKLMLAGTRQGNRKRTVRYGQYFILKALEA